MTSLHDIHQQALCNIATSLVAHWRYSSICRYPTLPRLCREVRIRMLMYLLVHILLDKTRLKKKEIAQLASIYSPICPSSLVTCSAFLTTGLVLKHGIIIKKPQVCPPCSIYSCSIYSCSIAALEYILIISSWWLLAFSIWWRFSRFPSHLFTHCPLGIGMS